MSTISENLQIIKDSIDAIKQAIINKGGEITGDITTWANTIKTIQTGGSGGAGSVFKITNKLNGHLFGGPTYSGQSANNFLDILHTYTFSGGTLGSNTIIANYNPNYTNVELFPNGNIHSYGGVATNEKISGIKAYAYSSLCGNFSLYTDDIGQITLVSSNTSPSSITCPVIYSIRY